MDTFLPFSPEEVIKLIAPLKDLTEALSASETVAVITQLEKEMPLSDGCSWAKIFSLFNPNVKLTCYLAGNMVFASDGIGRYSFLSKGTGDEMTELRV